MNNIPQVFWQVSINLECLDFSALYPMFVPVLLQVKAAAPGEQAGEKNAR